ncbi:MAG: hypothetical protein HC811_06835 [Flammeovirgaceae bacterium]|nr:hypothetical protein [Flammeovirgaceae bacterium]
MNHHSNYAIADIGQRKYDIVKEQRFYERATKRRPTEMSYLNLSHTYERTSSWIDALLVLEKASIEFPNSPVLENTKGLLFYEIDIPDSAIHYLKKATMHSSYRNSAETNLLAVAADYQLPLNTDSLYAAITSTKRGVKSNTLAYANFTNEKIELQLDLSDSSLNLFSATLINNYLLNHLGDVDSVSLNRIKQLARMNVNSVFSESLLFAVSLSHYAEGEVKKAFNVLKEVIFTSDRQGKYNNTLALWALEQNAPELALRYLEYAIFQNFDPAALTKSVALSEAGMIPEAIISWDFIRKGGDTTLVSLAERMMRILAVSNNLVHQLDDEEKYLYCRYRLKPSDSLQLLQIVSTITDNNYKAKTLLELSQKLYNIDELTPAIIIFNRLSEIEVTNSKLIQEGQLLELKLLASQGNYRALETQMKAFSFSARQKNSQDYFQAVLLNEKGNFSDAEKYFNHLAATNPFFEEAVISSAQFHKKHTSDPLKAYNIITDALHEFPESIKLLKAYAIEAKLNGFDDYANSALTRLQARISTPAFRSFIIENQLTFLPQDL